MDPVRTLAVSRKEWIQLRRDPRSLILAFLFPVLLLVFFGYAITWDVDDLALAVVDRDRTALSRELTEAFTSSGHFRVTRRPDGEGELEGLLIRGEVRGALVVPSGFQREVAAGRTVPVQLLLDGGDANTATIAQNYAEAITAGFGERVRRGAGGAQGLGGVPPIRAEPRIWYNPELRSRNMIVPGLIAVIMSIIAAMLTALTMAREWERGTMEQLVATPVHRLEVVVGKLLPYVGIGGIGVALTVAVGVPLFQVPLRGSLLFLSAQTLLFLVGALGLGIFISAATRSQVLATQVALIATYLPALLLSGFLFDIAAMPAPVRGLTFLVPARYFIDVTRGVFLKGVGIGVLWPQTLLMVAFAVLGLGLAAGVFRKEISR
jgi:ABC-2 type transport system permease protein